MKKRQKSGFGNRITPKNNNADASENPVTSVKKVPVIGIGASAGGLTALRTFFEALPEDSGMSFEVVVHLSPEHKSSFRSL